MVVIGTEESESSNMNYTISLADFNDLGNHRYSLTRGWLRLDQEANIAMAIGLNPSTANAAKDDPTIRRICSLLDANGYNMLYMVNLFSYITPYPEELQRVATCKYDEKQCKKIWAHFRDASRDVIFAWGNFDTVGRDQLAIKMFPSALCFGKNKNGSPKHPLYLKKDTKLVPFR